MGIEIFNNESRIVVKVGENALLAAEKFSINSGKDYFLNSIAKDVFLCRYNQCNTAEKITVIFLAFGLSLPMNGYSEEIHLLDEVEFRFNPPKVNIPGESFIDSMKDYLEKGSFYSFSYEENEVAEIRFIKE